MLLTVRSHFDAAHRLSGYHGACRNIHGHRWDVEVAFSISSPPDHVGITVDFGVLKQMVNGICSLLDHTLLLRQDAKNKLLAPALSELQLAVYWFEENPTAEFLVRWFVETLDASIRGSLTLATKTVSGFTVKLNESPDASATFGKTIHASRTA